jgi:hypothetical protein
MGITSLQGLGELQHLESLVVGRRNQLGSGGGLAPLSGLTRLTWLEASECGLQDLRPLAGCTALQARRPWRAGGGGGRPGGRVEDLGALLHLCCPLLKQVLPRRPTAHYSVPLLPPPPPPPPPTPKNPNPRP